MKAEGLQTEGMGDKKAVTESNGKRGTTSTEPPEDGNTIYTKAPRHHHRGLIQKNPCQLNGKKSV